MTNREKQVEELQDILINNGVFNNLVCRQDYAYPDALISDLCLETAEVIYNANYRKMDEVTLKLDLGDRSPEEIKQIAERFSRVMSTTPTALVSFSDEEIKKQVAKEIFEELRANEEANPEDCDCWLVAVEGEKFIKIAKKYGVEIKV